MNNLRVVGRYIERTEADVARVTLEAAGIPVYLADENMTRVAWLYSLALGGTRLFVPEDRFEEAREILATRPKIEEEQQSSGDSDVEDMCPSCGSDQVEFTQHDRRLRAFSMLLLWQGLPFLAWGKQLKCEACGYRWKLRQYPRAP